MNRRRIHVAARCCRRTSDRCRSKARRWREKGLTLVEVLVALAILGLVAASIVSLIGQNTRFIADQEAKMLAGMLADAAMVEKLAQRGAPERGETVEERSFAARPWTLRITVAETGVAGIVRIDAEVMPAQGAQVLARAMTLKVEAQ